MLFDRFCLLVIARIVDVFTYPFTYNMYQRHRTEIDVRSS